MNYLSVPTWLFTGLGYLGPILAACGGGLLAVAILTSRRGWEPRCRRCTHDLRSADPEAKRCPECGADLSVRGAVSTGRRQIRPVLALTALLVLSCAALAAWRLNPSEMPRIRATVIGWSPLPALIDAVFEGGADAELAEAILVGRLGTIDSSASSAPREIPSGELLDAVLASADRCEEAGRRPLAAVLQSTAVNVIGRLDAAEEQRLLELATAQLIASEGRLTDRLRLALAAGWPEFDGATNREKITQLLASSPEGRRLLELQPGFATPLVSGSIGSLTFQSMFDVIAPVSPRVQRQARTFILGEAMLETDAGVPVRRLPNARDRMFSRRESSGLGVGLLIDAPPGRHRLRISGAVVSTVLLPRVDSSSTVVPMITMDEALKLESAMRVECVGTIEVVPRLYSGIEYTTDAELMARVADMLGTARFADDGDREVSFHEALRRLVGSSTGNTVEPRVRSTVRVEQDGKSELLGGLSGDQYTAGEYPRDIPSTIDLAKPFAVVLSPNSPTNRTATQALHRWNPNHQPVTAARPTVFASFVLRFQNARAAPVVEIVPATLDPAVARKRDDDATRTAVMAWAAWLSPRLASEPGTRSGGKEAGRSRPWISLDGDGKIRFGADGQPTGPSVNPWPADLKLCGWIELRAGDRLVAPIVHAFGSLQNSFGNSLPVPLVDVGPTEALTVRYVPEEAARSSNGGGPFDYLSVPFELRYATNDSTPTLVWLDKVNAASESPP